MPGCCRGQGYVSRGIQGVVAFPRRGRSLGVVTKSTAHTGVSFFGQGRDEVPGPGEGESIGLLVTGRSQLLFHKHVTEQRRLTGGRHCLEI